MIEGKPAGRSRPISGESVTEVNAADGSWVRTVPGLDFGLSDPDGLVAAGQRVWVTNADAGTLTVLPPG